MKKRIRLNIMFIATLKEDGEPPKQGLTDIVTDWLLENYAMLEIDPKNPVITITVEDVGGDAQKKH